MAFNYRLAFAKSAMAENSKEDVAQSKTHNKILAVAQQYKINTD